MKRARTFLFWVHLSAGVAAGVVILIMSATGALLALKPQVLAAIDRDVRTVPVRAGVAARPSVDLMAANVRRARIDAKLTAISVQADPTAAVAFTVDGGTVIYVDGGTGDVLGEGSRAAQAFFRTLEDWHRWVGAAADDRATGRAITGACNLAFSVIALTGPLLWWPRRWSPANARAVLWFRRTATSRARDFNWHNVVGIWCAPVLIVLSLTGVVMSYRWANNLLYRLAGSTPPAAAASLAPPRALTAGPAPLDALVRQAGVHVPSWRTITMRLPARAGAPTVLTIVDARSWNAFARSQLTVDSGTAAVVRWEPYEASSLGQKMRGWARFSHTGELGGLPGQIVAGAASAGAVLLVWTGMALAARRLFAAAAPLLRRARSQLVQPSLER